MTAEPRKVESITGVVRLADGTESQFTIDRDYGWRQWGADIVRLGQSVDVMEAIVEGVRDAEIPWASSDDDDPDE